MLKALSVSIPLNSAFDSVSVVLYQVAIGKKAPKHNSHPKVNLHRQDNWKVAYEFMASAGIIVKGIEPAGITLSLSCAPVQYLPSLYIHIGYCIYIRRFKIFYPIHYRFGECESCCDPQHVCQHSKMGREKSKKYPYLK